MLRFTLTLAVAMVALNLFPMQCSRAADASAELERRSVQLQIQRIDLGIAGKGNGPEVVTINEQLKANDELLAMIQSDTMNRAKKKLAEIEAEMQKAKQGRKDEVDVGRLQLLDQARTALTKKLLELEVGFALPDDPLRNAKQMMGVQNSKLHLKLANGTELDAEGPWLQQSSEARDLLEQFNDPARDGALSFRVQDQAEVDAIREQLSKVAPAVKIEFSEKLRLLTAVSEDPAQLRRAAGVMKTLRPNGFNGFDPRMKNGEFNPNTQNNKNGMQDGDPRKMQPGKPGVDDVKKKNTVDDKF